MNERIRALLIQEDQDLEEVLKTARDLEDAIPVVTRLMAFYESPLWMELYNENLSFGCLSQDGIWNALRDLAESAEQIRKLIDKDANLQ